METMAVSAYVKDAFPDIRRLSLRCGEILARNPIEPGISARTLPFLRIWAYIWTLRYARTEWGAAYGR